MVCKPSEYITNESWWIYSLEKLYPAFLRSLKRVRDYSDFDSDDEDYSLPQPPINPILLPEWDYGHDPHWVIHPSDEEQQPIYGDHDLIALKNIYLECAPTYFVYTKRKTAAEEWLSKRDISEILKMTRKAALKWDNQDLLPHKFNPKLVQIRNYWILTKHILGLNYLRILTVLTIANYYLHLLFQTLHMVVLLK
jgi:hypothetical protein